MMNVRPELAQLSDCKCEACEFRNWHVKNVNEKYTGATALELHRNRETWIRKNKMMCTQKRGA